MTAAILGVNKLLAADANYCSTVEVVRPCMALLSFTVTPVCVEVSVPPAGQREKMKQGLFCTKSCFKLKDRSEFRVKSDEYVSEESEAPLHVFKV